MPSATTHDVTVLLIEDEAEIRRFLRTTLPPHGYRLYNFSGCSEGSRDCTPPRPPGPALLPGDARLTCGCPAFTGPCTRSPADHAPRASKRAMVQARQPARHRIARVRHVAVVRPSSVTSFFSFIDWRGSSPGRGPFCSMSPAGLAAGSSFTYAKGAPDRRTPVPSRCATVLNSVLGAPPLSPGAMCRTRFA